MRLLEIGILTLILMISGGIAFSQTATPPSSNNEVEPPALWYVSVADANDFQYPLEFQENKKYVDAYVGKLEKIPNFLRVGKFLKVFRIDIPDAIVQASGVSKSEKTTNFSYNCSDIYKAIALMYDNENPVRKDTFKDWPKFKDSDIVLFYHSGHGHAIDKSKLNNVTNMPFRFPAISCGDRPDEDIPLENIVDEIKSHAKLTIVIADSCNNFAPQPKPPVKLETRPTKQFDNNYAAGIVEHPCDSPICQLLLNFTGNIVLSGAKLKESSFYHRHSVGYFTRQLIDELSFKQSDSSDPK